MSKTYAENLVCVFDLSNNRNNTKLVLMADQEKFSGNTVWLISTFCFQLHFLFPGPDIMIILRKQLSHRLDKHNIKHIWLCYTAHFNSPNHPQHLLVVLTISLVSLSATIALHGEKSMRVLRVVLFEVCFWLIIPIMNTSPQRSNQRVENGVTHFLDQSGVSSVQGLNYSGWTTTLNLPTTTFHCGFETVISLFLLFVSLHSIPFCLCNSSLTWNYL